MSDRGEDLKLGARIRALRVQLGVTLADVAGRAQISIGQLSEIERGISAPSLRSLRLISESLGTPVGRLFDDGPASAREERFVMRRTARPTLKLTSTGVTKTLLSPRGSGTLGLYEIAIAPLGTSGGEFQTGPGEKAGIVTVGRMRVWIDGVPSDLAVGDSFQFPAELPHSLENPFETMAVLLWAVGPSSVPLADVAAEATRRRKPARAEISPAGRPA